jgi:hypothetical protein
MSTGTPFDENPQPIRLPLTHAAIPDVHADKGGGIPKPDILFA